MSWLWFLCGLWTKKFSYVFFCQVLSILLSFALIFLSYFLWKPLEALWTWCDQGSGATDKDPDAANAELCDEPVRKVFEKLDIEWKDI